MTHLAISQQVLLEHETLARITSEVRAAVFARDLARLRSVLLAFAEHLERTLVLEEEDGYMVAVLEPHPELRDDIELLRREHTCFRMSVDRLLTRLDSVAAVDAATCRKVSHDLLALLQKLDEHTAKEIGLLEQALLADQPEDGPDSTWGDGLQLVP